VGVNDGQLKKSEDRRLV